MQKIVVATDGSRSSAEALAIAIDLASRHGAELLIAHVAPTIDVLSPDGLDDTYAEAHEPTDFDRAVLENAAAVAAEHDIAATSTLLGGPPAAEIVAFADSNGADLIVIGSRGHGRLASALMGSVSLGVLRRSTTAVLVARAARSGHS